MVVVTQGDEAERLQTGALKFARWVQHFGHSADGAGASVESDLDEISGGELTVQLEIVEELDSLYAESAQIQSSAESIVSESRELVLDAFHSLL